MSIYEYVCDDCGTRYERVVLSQNQPITCPKCASERHTLQLSAFSTPAKSLKGSGGASFSGAACACTPKSCGCN